MRNFSKDANLRHRELLSAWDAGNILSPARGGEGGGGGGGGIEISFAALASGIGRVVLTIEKRWSPSIDSTSLSYPERKADEKRRKRGRAA